MADRPSRVFYRLVQTDPPALADFKSYEALGIVPQRPLSRRGRDRWRRVSRYASLQAALAKQRDFPWLGTSIAIARIPAGAPVRIEQTGGDRAHYMLRADPSLLRSCVVSVEGVERLH